MNILHITKDFLPNTGGTVSRIYSSIVNDGHFHYILIPSKYFKAYYIDENIQVIHLNVKKRNVCLPVIQTYLNSYDIYQAAKKYIKDYKIKINLLYSHNPIQYSLAILWISKYLKIKYIHEIHGLIYDFYNLEAQRIGINSIINHLFMKIIKQAEKAIFNHSSMLIVQTDLMKNRIIELYSINKEKIKVIYNGVDLKKFNSVDKTKQNTKKHLMYAGYLDEINGIDFLIKSFIKLKLPDVKLLIAGRGPLEKLVETISNENDNIEYYRVISSDNICNFYDKADIFLLTRPSTLPGETLLPMKLLEVSALNKIILASDMQIIREVSKEINNIFLFKSDDFESFSDCLKNLINSSTLIKDNYDVLNKNFNWNTNKMILDELYNMITSDNINAY